MPYTCVSSNFSCTFSRYIFLCMKFVSNAQASHLKLKMTNNNFVALQICSIFMKSKALKILQCLHVNITLYLTTNLSTQMAQNQINNLCAIITGLSEQTNHTSSIIEPDKNCRIRDIVLFRTRSSKNSPRLIVCKKNRCPKRGYVTSSHRNLLVDL